MIAVGFAADTVESRLFLLLPLLLIIDLMLTIMSRSILAWIPLG